jgi:PEP-CTERM motif
MAYGIRWIRIAVAIAASGLMPAPSIAGPLDPLQFSSLGTLSLSTPGTYLILAPQLGSAPTLVVGNTTYTGVIYNGVAVFDFTSINIASGVTLSANITFGGSGTLPVALLSQTSASIAGGIELSGAGSSFGQGAGSVGTGGSIPGYVSYVTGSGGGGFGGSGGQGQNFQNLMTGGIVPGGAGGGAHADLGYVLQGGSPGGYGSNPARPAPGGGAIELGAVQSLSISGSIDASGANGILSGTGGGGGSGGGIFLHASSVSLTGEFSATGGNGATGSSMGEAVVLGGGGGGGGAMLVEYGQGGFSDAGAQFSLTGGSGSGSGIFQAVMVPEPSSLFLLGTSTLGLLGASIVRQMHRRRACLGA